jgi:hypothetical protein
MKNVVLSFGVVALLAICPAVSRADLVVNFDTSPNWTAGSTALTSYTTNHTYIQSGLTFTGGPALRNTAAVQDGFAGALGIFAWRLQDNSTVSWSATYSDVQAMNEGVSGFSFSVRRWDASPSPNFTVSYSLNGGTSYTTAGTINNASLGNSSNWSTFSSAALPLTLVNDGDFIVRVAAAGSTERIMIDNFTLSAAAVPEASAFLYGGLIATSLIGWKWRQKRRVEQVLI